jgi:hypothetical protein
MGQYLAIIVEAPASSHRNIPAQTLRAFSAEEMDRIYCQDAVRNQPVTTQRDSTGMSSVFTLPAKASGDRKA